MGTTSENECIDFLAYFEDYVAPILPPATVRTMTVALAT